MNRINDLIDGIRIDGDLRPNGDSIYGRNVGVIELLKRSVGVTASLFCCVVSLYRG